MHCATTEIEVPKQGRIQRAPKSFAELQRIGSLNRASIILRLRMRRDFLRLILGAPGEIHLSQTLSARISHFDLQPFLNDEFLHTRTSVRG